MRLALAMAALAAAGTAWAQVGPPPLLIPHVIVNPEYAREPTVVDYVSVYPPAALKARLEGTARIRCSLSAQGKLSDCTVLSEDPPGQGFGEAAIRFVLRVGVTPKTRDGEPVAGDFEIPVRFSPP